MKAVLSKLNIPDMVNIGSIVYNASGTIELVKAKSGQIESGNINIKLICEIDVEGVEIKFNSHISHTLTTKEMDELMLKFSK